MYFPKTPERSLFYEGQGVNFRLPLMGVINMYINCPKLYNLFNENSN